MKKLFCVLLSGLMCLSLAGCGGSESGGDASQAGDDQAQEEAATPPDLTGEWKQVNNESEDSWQAATITADSMEVYWVSDNGETKSLYWAGTFTAPETADEPYTWDSANDTEKTSSALLASGAETKTFTYQDNQISYEVTALGVTTTVKLEKQ